MDSQQQQREMGQSVTPACCLVQLITLSTFYLTALLNNGFYSFSTLIP